MPCAARAICAVGRSGRCSRWLVWVWPHRLISRTLVRARPSRRRPSRRRRPTSSALGWRTRALRDSVASVCARGRASEHCGVLARSMSLPTRVIWAPNRLQAGLSRDRLLGALVVGWRGGRGGGSRRWVAHVSQQQQAREVCACGLHSRQSRDLSRVTRHRGVWRSVRRDER